ncbi:contractile injection system tape measure protein [Photorhabdus heterorhabditis]|uniref:contractile injection system tape measure protein n=1 Tax=Photorhabdus heterorhabditis TaxID=880156 RepID=UPI001BD261D8|nr:contractile injection system tape measure protein [Photorhabdus heterorhabditis]MBS9440744.1 hypothetical protein [Photorhabdus heterorhabditis]
MVMKTNLLNRIVITIETNNAQIAKKILHNSMLNKININGLINSCFNQHNIDQNIHLEELTLNLGEINLHNFNSLFYARLRVELNKALSQYQTNNHQEEILLNKPISNKLTDNTSLSSDNHLIDAENFIHFLYQKDPPINPMEVITDNKNSNIKIKPLINQLMQIENKSALLLAKGCLSEQGLQRLLAIRQPALLIAINRRLSKRVNKSQHQEELVSSEQLILNALEYIQRYNTQEMPKPDTKIISRITTELNNGTINIASIIALFRQAATRNSTLNNWLKLLWQTAPVSQNCKKHLSVEEYQYLSEYFITTGENNHDQHRTDDTQLSEPTLLPEQALPHQVSHAGILVLWPILPVLFNQLGLLEKQKFIHRQAQFSAVALLDYLIWGTEKAPIERKGLNHILCGLMVDENIESTPIEPEKQLATEQWLDGVISQLPAWKKLSHNDVRQLFLQRPGELRIDEQEIKITVQPQPFDALLNDWPWPLNIAKLPWLDRPLLINWQNI